MRTKKVEKSDNILPVEVVDVATITETLLKVANGNEHHLSDMADHKAQLLITVNSLILSAIISLTLGHITQFRTLAVPVLILLITSLVTLVFAIVSTRPSLPRGKFTMNDIKEKNVNLLFFGNFYDMSKTDFSAGMTHLLCDPDYIYKSLVTDLYKQGIVLGRKFRLLRIAYNVFMIGFILAITTFLVVMRDHILGK